MHVSIRRARAAQSCIDRFAHRPYEPGVRDCPLLALHDLHKLRIKVPWAKGLRWRSEAEGLRALKRLGFRDLIAAVDSLGFARIAPASALPADLIALPTSHQLGALAIHVGNASLLAFTENSPNAEVLTGVTEFMTDDLGPCAWRVI